MRNPGKRSIIILSVAAILLIIPFICMQFSEEINWTGSDFIVFGILLFGTGLLFELTTRKIAKTKHRILLYIIIAGIFLIVWAELAVGIFGSPFAGN